MFIVEAVVFEITSDIVDICIFKVFVSSYSQNFLSRFVVKKFPFGIQ